METLRVENLTKKYVMGDTVLVALNGVSLTINKGEFVAITGQSGSGKSTLMNMLGCLDVPTEGAYFIDGENVAQMNRDELAIVRNKKIGFVFQKFHLLPDLTATQNVALPALYAGFSEEESTKRAIHNLSIVDLGQRLDHYPFQLSGGQQQRVAIARSLMNNPSILLADEPTGNLDSATGDAIMALFKKLNQEKSVTIVLVTHEHDVALHAKRIISLRDGKIVSDSESKQS